MSGTRSSARGLEGRLPPGTALGLPGERRASNPMVHSNWRRLTQVERGECFDFLSLLLVLVSLLLGHEMGPSDRCAARNDPIARACTPTARPLGYLLPSSLLDVQMVSFILSLHLSNPSCNVALPPPLSLPTTTLFPLASRYLISERGR